MMKILDDLIASLNCDAEVRDIRLGIFQTAVYTRGCGLASTPHGIGHTQGNSPVRETGFLKEKNSRELVELVKSENLFEASIGMAAINSLIEVDVDKCREMNAAVLLGEKGNSKKVAIVGHFPFIPQLKEICDQVWVIEKNPDGIGHTQGNSPVRETGFLKEKNSRELVELVKSENLFEASIGMAAINSLIEVDVDKCREMNAAVLLGEKGNSKKVAIVGHFPFIPQLKEICDQVWVIEKNPVEDEYTEEEAEKLISQADVVGITGMTITNHTLDNLLNYCSPNTYVMILGGTTPLSPVLFDYGIDSLSGTVVTRPDSVLDAVSQGATYRQLKDVKRLIMEK